MVEPSTSALATAVVSSTSRVIDIDALFESSLVPIVVPGSSYFVRTVADIIADAEDQIRDTIMTSVPTSSGAIQRQLNRISSSVSSILEELHSAWTRTERLQLENNHLERLFSRSIVDRQDLRDILNRQALGEKRDSVRAEVIMTVCLVSMFYFDSNFLEKRLPYSGSQESWATTEGYY